MDIFRKSYTELTEAQKEGMVALKDKAMELYDLMEAQVPASERSERARCMNIARTDLEKSVMMAVKAVTTKQE